VKYGCHYRNNNVYIVASFRTDIGCLGGLR
jgi:hypothetical protein